MAATSQADQRIRALTEEFISELSIVIRQTALDTMRQAFGEVATPAPRGRQAAGRKPGRKPGPKPGRTRVRRSTADVGELGGSIVGEVTRRPGISATEIASNLGVTTKDLRLPILKLLGDRSLRTEGRARGTKYFVGGTASGPARKTGKKAGRKKRGKKA